MKITTEQLQQCLQGTKKPEKISLNLQRTGFQDMIMQMISMLNMQLKGQNTGEDKISSQNRTQFENSSYLPPKQVADFMKGVNLETSRTSILNQDDLQKLKTIFKWMKENKAQLIQKSAGIGIFTEKTTGSSLDEVLAELDGMTKNVGPKESANIFNNLKEFQSIGKVLGKQQIDLKDIQATEIMEKKYVLPIYLNRDDNKQGSKEFTVQENLMKYGFQKLDSDALQTELETIESLMEGKVPSKDKEQQLKNIQEGPTLSSEVQKQDEYKQMNIKQMGIKNEILEEKERDNSFTKSLENQKSAPSQHEEITFLRNMENMKSPFPSEEIQNTHDIITKMVDEIQVLKERDQSSIQLQLKPEKLGKIEIQLKMKDGEVIGKILVEDIVAKKAIESQVQNLKERLKDQNIVLQDINIDLQQNNQGQSRKREHAFFSQNHHSSKKFLKQMVQEQEPNSGIFYSKSSFGNSYYQRGLGTTLNLFI